METIGRFGLRGLGHVRGKFEREIIAAGSAQHPLRLDHLGADIPFAFFYSLFETVHCLPTARARR